MTEKERGHCFKREKGMVSRGENLDERDDSSLDPSDGVVGVKEPKGLPVWGESCEGIVCGVLQNCSVSGSKLVDFVAKK